MCRYGRMTDYTTACREFNAAIDGGCSLGSFGLGYAYWMGKGVKRDITRARTLFDFAANDGVGAAIAYKAMAMAVCDTPGPERNAHAQANIRKAIATGVRAPFLLFLLSRCPFVPPCTLPL